MEYGLWNLHGGFWAGSNPCSGDGVGRSLYNSVSASGTGPFHGCGESVSFSTATATPPCRSAYRSQPEYVAMKPAVMPTRSSTNGLELGNGHTGERAEQTVMPLQNDMMAEHSSGESINSLHGQPGLSTASLSSTMSLNPLAQSSSLTPITNQTHKKAKSAKHQRKNMSGSNKSESNAGTGTWNRSNANEKTENALQYLNQQYNPMYSMMFGRLPVKRLDNVSDYSDDDDDDDDDDGDNDNDNEVDGDGYSNQSAMPNRSPECLGSQTSTTTGGRSGYECGECGLVADTRPGLKKHIAVSHPTPGPDPNLAQALLSKIAASCPMASCRFRSSERDELEAHVARHVAEGYSPTGKKRAGPVSLQRVR